MSTINKDLLPEAIERGWVTSRKHPGDDLYIYNYTAQVQYERAWNEITLACRGLVLNAGYNIVAHPFPKFFNLGGLADVSLPAGDFEVYEKMDGFQHGIANDMLQMRMTGDGRKDAIVKKQLFDEAIRDRYYIEFVLDDRNQVVDMWRDELKLPCFQVYYGDF